MRFQHIIFILFLSLFVNCSKTTKKTNIFINANEIKNKEAKLFKIYDFGSIKKLTVYNKKNQFLDEYYLIPKAIKIPDSLLKMSIIRTPVKNVVCLSTTHISFLDKLKVLPSLKGVSGSNYIFNNYVRNSVANQKIKDVGYDNSLDFETLISLKPDMVTVYDINGAISPTINKLKKFNIPVVQINEYLETSALGQAEWLKFFAEFFNKREFANKEFSKIYKNYNKLLTITDTLKNKPTVLLNMPWKGTWYVAGGKSNIAKLIFDAGGNYVYKENLETHNTPLSIENVYLKAKNVNFWLNVGQAKSIADILNNDKRLSKFKVFKTKNIFNRNKRLNAYGGNDYMESGTVNPDIILKDLIKILHPDILKNDSLYYYTKLK